MRAALLVAVALTAQADALVVATSRSAAIRYAAPTPRAARCGMEAEPDTATREPSDAASSLESKMAAWETTEEERKAATLGGIVPKKSAKVDGFDLGMTASLAILAPLAIGVLSFPFWIGNFAAGLPAVDVTQ